MHAKRKWIAAAAVLIVIGTIVAVWQSRQKSDAGAPQAPAALDTVPVPFGYKTAWYTVRTQDAGAVAAALGLQQVRPAGWHPGLSQATDGDSGLVFVTPSVKGWVLAVGKTLMIEPKYEDKVKALSRQFGEAQYYASMASASAYIWVRAKNGEVTCLFDTANGREPRREGSEHELESVVRLRFVDDRPPDQKDPSEKDRREAPFPDEQDVLRVAQVWSLNPMKMSDDLDAQYSGLIGRYPR